MIDHWLMNLGIQKKLWLGFGLLLVIIGLMAMFSLRGFDAYAGWLDQAAQLDRLKLALQSVGLAEKDYAYRHDGQSLDAHGAALKHLNEQLDAVALESHSTSGLESLAAARQQLQQYADEFQQLQARIEATDAAQNTMLQGATGILTRFASLQKSASIDLMNSAPTQASVQQAIDLANLINDTQNLRILTWSFVNSPRDALRKQFSNELGKLKTRTERLRTALAGNASGNPADALSQNLAAFDSYGETFDSVVQATTDRQARQASMEDRSAKAGGFIDQVLAGQASEQASASRTLRLLLAGGLLAALGVGGLAAWVITRQIVPPLRRTVAFAQRIAEGDLSSEITSQRRDEVGQLQSAMQAMNGNLRELAAAIHQGVAQIASAAEELAAGSERNNVGAHAQKSEIDQVATAITEMAATVQEVARSTEQASMAAQQARERSSHGVSVIDQTLQQIDALASDVESLDQAMARMHGDSARIGKVVDVIKAVAEQTNLLALNAAIEAARAGEAGRGFAVVADEVRGLAIRTQASTREIEALVAALHQGSQATSELMQRSRQRTHHAVQLTHTAQKALEQINQAVAHIQSLNLQIAAATEEQSAVATEIDRNVLTISDLAEQSAASTTGISRSSQELATLGSQLQVVAGRFRS